LREKSSTSRSRSAFTFKELEPKHLRENRDRVIASTGSLGLVDELIGLRRLLGDGVDGVLENLTLSGCHRLIVSKCGCPQLTSGSASS
jgi:hypothetical protein